MLDAYTVKKMLPRLVIAVLLVNLSWFIATSLLNTSNEVGGAIYDLLWAPFSGTDIKKGLDVGGALAALFGFGASIAVVPVALWATIGGGWAVILTTLLTVAAGILVAFAVLVVREVLIITLIMISPLALVLWVLPGTESWAKKWWGLYSKLLLMYPLFMGMLAAGEIISSATYSGTGSIIDNVVSIAIYIAPYFMLPFLFKFIGGFMGQISGIINDKEKGLLDRSKKWSGEKTANSQRSIERNAMKDRKLGYKKQRYGLQADEKLAGHATSRLPWRRSSRMSGMSQADFEVQRAQADQARQEYNNRTVNLKAELNTKAIQDALKDLKAEIELNPGNSGEIQKNFVNAAIARGDTAAVTAALTHAADTGDVKAATHIYDQASGLAADDPMRNTLLNAQNANHPNLKAMSPGLVGGFGSSAADSQASRAAKIHSSNDEAKAGMKAEAWADYEALHPDEFRAARRRILDNDNLKGKYNGT